LKKEKTIAFTLSIFILLLIFLLSSLTPSENLLLGQEPIYSLNEGWDIKVGETYYENISLPVDLNLPPDTIYTASIVLDEAFSNKVSLLLRSSMQHIKISLDNETIFITEKPEQKYLVSPEASLWYFIDLPYDAAGKILSLEITSPYKAFSGIINTISFGAGRTLLYNLLQSHFVGLFVAFMLIIIGVLALSLACFLKNMTDNRILYLGIFALLVGIWLLSEARLMQFFTGNRFIIGGISYMIVSLIPIPLVLYLRAAVVLNHKKLLNSIAILFIINFFINLFLQSLVGIGFIQLLKVTNSFILGAILVIIIILISEAIKHKNETAKMFLQYLSILLLVAVIEILHFFIQSFDSISKYTRIGIVVFFIFLIRDVFKYMDELLTKEKEAQILEKLAFKDILTGAPNRGAFQRDLELLLSDDKKENFRLIMMDINDLKQINDEYGHKEGDNAIKIAYEYMTSAFKSGTSYRLGGDEFTCIMKDTEISIYNNGVDLLLQKFESSKNKFPYFLNMAIGSDVYYYDKNINIDEFIHSIDQLMYYNKQKMKKTT
jgi:diguanylate cyclase (GGDEF)-like protein